MEKYTWNKVRQSQKTGNFPAMRWGHSCCVINDEVVFFGGYADSNYMSDVWTFHTITMEWTEIQTKGDVPSPRSNCSMNYDADNNQVVVFGGGGANKKRFNTVNVLDWDTKEWIQIQPKDNETSPWERTYHTAQLYYPYLVVFGGEGVSDLEDLWVFNFLNLSWSEVPINKTAVRPCGRRFHSSARIGNEFFVIAGCYAKYRCLSDIYSIDLTQLIEKGTMTNLGWRERKLENTTFLTRWGHTSTVYNNKIYIFGGRFSNDLQDILVADFDKNSLSTLKTTIQVPKARRRHSACFLGSSLLLFGGFNGQYFNDLHYINIFQAKKKPVFKLQPNFAGLQALSQDTRFSDGHLASSEGNKTPICKGLLMKSFPKIDALNQFLEQLDGALPIVELQSLLQKLYVGFGKIDQTLTNRFGITMFESKNELDIQNRLKINGQQCYKMPVFPRRGAPAFNPLINLSSCQFQNYLQKTRSEAFSDFIFLVNKQYYLATNKSLLALESSYFKNLLSGQYSEKNQVEIEMDSGSIINFEIMLNYISQGYLVVPNDLQASNWMGLLEMADYFSLPGMVRVCEAQLQSRIDDTNCQVVLLYALDMGLESLSTVCAQYLIKMMVNRQNEYNNIFQEVEDEYLGRKKEEILKKVYNLLRFDILQKKIQKQEMLASVQLTKISSEHNSDHVIQEEKQNYENNFK